MRATAAFSVVKLTPNVWDAPNVIVPPMRRSAAISAVRSQPLSYMRRAISFFTSAAKDAMCLS